MRLVLIGAVIALMAVGCGGGDSPTQTVAQNGSSESEATAIPTSTAARDDSSESEATAVPTSTAARDGSSESEATAVPTQTVAQNGSSESEATAVPTQTVAQNGSSESSRVAEYAAAIKCGETSEEDDPETFGEAARILDEWLDPREDVTPPEELKDYHDKNLALSKAMYDFIRSQDANEPYDLDVLSEFFESIPQVSEPVIAAINALDDETKAQLDDAGCFGS